MLEKKPRLESWGTYFSRKRLDWDGWGAYFSRKRLDSDGWGRISRERSSKRGVHWFFGYHGRPTGSLDALAQCDPGSAYVTSSARTRLGVSRHRGASASPIYPSQDPWMPRPNLAHGILVHVCARGEPWMPKYDRAQGALTSLSVRAHVCVCRVTEVRLRLCIGLGSQGRVAHMDPLGFPGGARSLEFPWYAHVRPMRARVWLSADRVPRHWRACRERTSRGGAWRHDRCVR